MRLIEIQIHAEATHFSSHFKAVNLNAHPVGQGAHTPECPTQMGPWPHLRTTDHGPFASMPQASAAGPSTTRELASGKACRRFHAGLSGSFCHDILQWSD